LKKGFKELSKVIVIEMEIWKRRGERERNVYEEGKKET
jgi:hypothetical protein